MTQSDPESEYSVDGNEFAISSEHFIGLAEELFSKDRCVRVSVSGKSMKPVLVEDDVITISPYGNRAPLIGEIALFKFKSIGCSLMDLDLKGCGRMC